MAGQLTTRGDNPLLPHNLACASNKDKRIAQLQRDAKWRADYAEQRENLMAWRPTKLPYGAYLLARVDGVPVAKPP